MRRRLYGQGLGPLVAAMILGAVVALWTWTAPANPDLWPASAADPGVPVHVLDNGFHTDLAVPRQALEAQGGPLAVAVQGLAQGDWILIGWGDARFYVEQGPIAERLPDGARAFFRPRNPSVIMLDPTLGDPADRVGSDRRRSLRLSLAGFEAMVRHIEASLELTDGRARVAAVRPGDDARFFASREHFWIGRLCNHWSAEALHAAGLPIRPFRSITSSEVMATIERAQLDTAAVPD